MLDDREPGPARAGPQPAGGHPPAQATEPLASMVSGLQWALALVLVLQALFGAALPSVTDAVVHRWLARHLGACLGPCQAVATPLLPWVVLAALHLAQARLLRRRGPFPLSDAQVLALTLVPGWNLAGAVALFTAEGEALERLGAGRGLARQLRAGAALAVGLGVAQVALAVGRLRPAIVAGWVDPAEVNLPGEAPGVLTLAFLLACLFLLGRLQVANHRLLASDRGAPPSSSTGRTAGGAATSALGSLLEPRLAIGVAVLAAAAVSLAALPTRRWQERSRPSAAGLGLPTLPPAPTRPPATLAAAPAMRPAAPAPAPAVRSAPLPPPEALFAGRPATWWTDRLRRLAARTDPEGLELLALTRDRAVANGLAVLEGPDGPRVAPATPERERTP